MGLIQCELRKIYGSLIAWIAQQKKGDKNQFPFFDRHINQMKFGGILSFGFLFF